MKIKSIVLALIICMCAQLSAFAQNDVLTALKIMPSGLDASSTATRELLAYTAVKISGNEAAEGKELPFDDIAESKYIDYIAFAYNSDIMKGVSDTKFAPNDAVTLETADAVLVRTLGYESVAQALGGGMTGYVRAAERLGINSGIGNAAEAEISVGALGKMLGNLLESNVVNVNISGESITLDKQDRRYLNEKLGLSVYKGMITEASADGKYAKVYLETAKYKKDETSLKTGYTYNLKVENGADAYENEYVEAYIWTDKDDNIVYIDKLNDVDVIYTHIYSVNGDESSDSEYKAKYINKMVFYFDSDEKYSVANGAVIKYNGKNAADTNEKYVDRFAKVVLKDDEVVYADCYDASLFGLVSDVTSEGISCISGDGAVKKVRDIDKYDNVKVFIDGVKASVSDIKPNSVINVYSDDELLFVEASEKAISEKLDSVGDTEIIIGGTAYDKEDTYFSADGEYYTLNSGMNKLYRVMVTAYFDPLGNCVFVCPGLGQTANAEDFIGVIISYGEKGLEDPQMKLLVIEPEIEEKIYTVAKNVKFADGLNLNTVKASAGAGNESAVYLFETNAKGEISKISSTKPVYGFAKSVGISYFVDEPTNAYIGMSTDGGYKTLFCGDAPVYVLCNEDGDTYVRKITWADIRNYNVYNGKSVTLSMFGKDLEATPRMLLLTGDVDSIYYNERKFAVLTEKVKQLDEKGDVVYKITLQGSTKNVATVTEEFGDTLPANAAMFYYNSKGYGTKQNFVLDGDILDLSGNPDTWDIETFGLKKSTVKRIDEKRLFVDDGTPYGNEYGNPLYMYTNFILKYDENASDVKGRFKRISVDEVEEGWNVIYYLRGELRGMIVYE